MYRQVHDPPPPPTLFRPDLPGPAEEALLRQLAKVPDERFPSSQEFVDALSSPLARPHPETQATSIADITRPGFDPPTPGSGQTPVPRSGRVTRPVTAATLTPPGARALPKVPPAPLPRRDDTRPTSNPGAVLSPTVPAAPSTMAEPGRKVGFPIGAAIGLVAVLAALAAVVLVAPIREVVVAPFVAVTPTSAAVEQPTPRATAVVTPATSTPQAITPTAQAITPTARAVTQTPQAATPTAQVLTPTPAAPPTLTPNQRLAQVRDTFEAGNHASALALLDELRHANPSLAGLDDAEYDIRVGFARSLLEQGNADAAYEQFGGALKVRPGDPTATNGQNQIILAKNYAIMEAAWDTDIDLAINALEENMARDAGYRDTRPKLYALLIRKADRLLAANERDAAFPVLTRAIQVLPDGGEAQQRLVSYTPTPAPTPVPPPPASQPASQPPASKPQQPASKPQQPANQQPQPSYQQPAPRPATGTGTGSSGSGYGAGSSCPGGVCP
jgi:hypothetical protein